MITGELKQLIEKNPITLSTINKDNAPHTIYVACAKVINECEILITDNYMEKTNKNILTNKNVSLSILVGDAGYELIGESNYFDKGNYLDQVKNILENKNEPCKGAIVVLIKEIVKMG
jgi:hypothetical protein